MAGGERVRQAVEGLVALVRAAPRSVLEQIADCEHHARPGDRESHITALIDVVERLECRLDRHPDNEWFPREPVELMAWGAGGDDLAVCVANALLMISDLESDERDYMRPRWEERPGEAFFTTLPEALREPLSAGFHLLMERWTRPDGQPPFPTVPDRLCRADGCHPHIPARSPGAGLRCRHRRAVPRGICR